VRGASDDLLGAHIAEWGRNDGRHRAHRDDHAAQPQERSSGANHSSPS
jgi:hypothetical protein